ncbi:MAG TPA: N-acetyltransferase [Acidimicrobiales bacterium]|nr:N-acetyltransferase [Acidimicrobiales bacterium]
MSDRELGSPPEPDVRDVPAEHRFVVAYDGAVAQLVYRLAPEQLVLVHTEVPDELGGRGIGGRLVRAAADRAAADHLTVVPWCPFARRWLRDHPDVASSIAIDWDSAPPEQESETADG